MLSYHQRGNESWVSKHCILASSYAFYGSVSGSLAQNLCPQCTPCLQYYHPLHTPFDASELLYLLVPLPETPFLSHLLPELSKQL